MIMRIIIIIVNNYQDSPENGRFQSDL
jgi:hypothetical protein